MTCTRIAMPGGGHAIVCSREPLGRRQPRCTNCGEPAQWACDWPTGNRHRCNRPLCERCRKSISPTVDYCPEHAHARELEIDAGRRPPHG